MPRGWHALPLPTDPRMLVKAPNYATFLDQEHALAKGGFFLPREPDAEHPLVVAMMDSIEDIQTIKPGQEYVLYRYPQGLAVRAPSGWTFMMPYDIKTGLPVANPARSAPKGGR